MKFISPCKICIVSACCTVYCNNYGKYTNRIIDNLWKMTNDQMNEFELSNPNNIKKIIHELYKNNHRFNLSDNLKPELRIL